MFKKKEKDTFYLISFNYSATPCYKFQNIEFLRYYTFSSKYKSFPWQLNKFPE